MRVNINIEPDLGSLQFCGDGLFKLIEGYQPEVETTMAQKFHQITQDNFGELGGIDRPDNWPYLTPGYARKVGRFYATLYVTGALRGAIKTGANEVWVSNSDVPYALAHQFGSAKNHLPARPYFPIDEDGKCLPFTYEQVKVAAEKQLLEMLS